MRLEDYHFMSSRLFLQTPGQNDHSGQEAEIHSLGPHAAQKMTFHGQRQELNSCELLAWVLMGESAVCDLTHQGL